MRIFRTLESPSGSMDILPSEMQYDSDFDVEPELPSLKQVLGEETVRKLKPKEKKRQDVINGKCQVSTHVLIEVYHCTVSIKGTMKLLTKR